LKAHARSEKADSLLDSWGKLLYQLKEAVLVVNLVRWIGDDPIYFLGEVLVVSAFPNLRPMLHAFWELAIERPFASERLIDSVGRFNGNSLNEGKG
jgi:hypothetical protein